MIRSRKSLNVVLVSFLALGFSMAQAQDSNITYNTHVANIINENCVVCHREGGIGPMQFENFDQVRPWAPLISLKVASREMPPSKPSQAFIFTSKAMCAGSSALTAVSISFRNRSLCSKLPPYSSFRLFV